MFGKLIKNEFKSTAHSVMYIYLAAVITIGMMLLSYSVKLKWISTLSTVALMLISVIAVIITLVAVISGFYKSLYGAQGYLSFTLPVKSGELLASKALVSFVWILLSYIIAVSIWIGIYFYAAAKIGQDRITAIKELMKAFQGIPGEKAIKQMLIFLGIMVFVQITVLISQIYFSITLANTRVFQKYGMITALFIFFAVYIVMQILAMLLTTYVPVTLSATQDGLAVSFSNNMMSMDGIAFGLTGTMFQILAAAGLFTATSYLMKHKINVK